MKNLVILAMATHAAFSCGHDGSIYQNIDTRIEARQNGRYVEMYASPPTLVSSGHFLEFTGYSSDIAIDSRVNCEWIIKCGGWTRVDTHEWGTCRIGWTIPLEHGSYDTCTVDLIMTKSAYWNEKEYKGETSGRFRFDNR